MHAVTLALMLFGSALLAAASTETTTTTHRPAQQRQQQEQQQVVLVSAHFGEHNACCTGDNVFDEVKRNCTTGKHSLHCSKFILDPASYAEDEYRTTQHGLELSGFNVENGRFCHVNLRSNGSAVTRVVVMVCFDESKQQQHLYVLKGSLAMVSVVCILATLYVYYLIPGLRETQDKVTCCALSCLLLFMVLLGTAQLTTPSSLGGMCMSFGTGIYFFTLAYFMWLNVIMWNVWKTTIMPKWKINERMWYTLNHVYAWTLPLVLTGAVLAQPATSFSMGSCFLEKEAIAFYLYVPMAVILCVNVVLFFWSAWGIHASGMDVSPDARRALAYKFRLYLKLITLAGITWIFELLSFYFGTNDSMSFWLIPDVMNALHGLGVFLVLVVSRRRIRKELAGKRILGIRTPASWSKEAVDSEEGGLHVDEKEPYDRIIK